MLVPLTVLIWRFNTRFFLNIKKSMDKNNHQLKILYKCIKANTSAIWQQMLHISPTKYSSPNHLKKETRATQKKPTFQID